MGLFQNLSGKAASRKAAVMTASSRSIYGSMHGSMHGHMRITDQKRPIEYFGIRTFSYDTMADRLSPAEFKLVKEHAESNQPLTLDLANKIAPVVKEWATSRGATHFCHWFQPQTGATAEKHDAFISLNAKGQIIEKFSGKELIQSEPDASSFPSGGIRATFEARGYTAWDASSPMFLMKTDNGSTLCIPSLFVSYSGEALDKKTPLLKSMAVLNQRALESLKLLGVDNITHVFAAAGPEQEYFVVDEALYAIRPDLIYAGRTLIGCEPPRGQQLEDHYYGSIKPRILNFMMECERELYELGVPCKTRHNEVAPCQYEIAPYYENANIAADHNQLVMEVLRTVAKRHHLVVLFHEKPYAGVNGSGKHVNWSLADTNGNNLLDPGVDQDQNQDPNTKLRFLYFLTATVKAIHDHGALLRVAVASPSNDFRLGANEAPPAIMSVFLGDHLSKLFNDLTNAGNSLTSHDWKKEIHLSIGKVPVIARDNTDRNRTSPFAFTGNKFEFRAVGSSASISSSLTYLNSAVSEALSQMNEMVRHKKGTSEKATNEQILSVIQDVAKATSKILFEGNNYSEEWHHEAERRGLPNLRSTPEALAILKEEKYKKLLSSLGIFTPQETEARYRVRLERYIKIRLIELETLSDMLSTLIIPAAMAEQASLAQCLKQTMYVLNATSFPSQTKWLANIASHTEDLVTVVNELSTFINKVKDGEDEEKVALLLAKDGMKLMEKARQISDRLETLIDDDLWPIPKYRELLTLI